MKQISTRSLIVGILIPWVTAAPRNVDAAQIFSGMRIYVRSIIEEELLRFQVYFANMLALSVSAEKGLISERFAVKKDEFQGFVTPLPESGLSISEVFRRGKSAYCTASMPDSMIRTGNDVKVVGVTESKKNRNKYKEEQCIFAILSE